MKLNSMIYPGLEITEFVIKEEIENRRVLQHYQNTLVIRKENILHKLQYYDKFNAQLNKYVYVKTKYGIIKGYRSRYNRKGQMDFRYRIFNILESDMDAFIDYIETERLFTPNTNIKWVVFRGKHNQLLMSESDVAEQRHYTKQLENVKTKSIDGQILNFETEYTNNLGVQFKVRCKKLHCMVRWIKYKGKIYRTVRYNTQTLGIEVNRKFEGINHAAKSEYIEHLINYNNDYIDSTYMRMDRVWFVDEQLGGLSVRQYRRLRNKLYNALKENNILAYKLSIGILNHPSTEKEYHIDPTVHLFLDEVFRDITEDEKEHILEIEKRNAMMRQSKRIGQ